MRKKWKKILCWLTGGHRYADMNLTSVSMPEHDATCFINHCVKCGKRNVYAVKNSALFAEIRPAMPEVKFDAE